MSDVELWHNPRCGKSREALSLLRARGVEPKIVLYLEAPPTAKRISEVLAMLGLEPRALMRTKEPRYKELRLDDAKKKPADLVRAMAENPILIERPVAIRGKRAVLGRPPENVLDLLGGP